MAVDSKNKSFSATKSPKVLLKAILDEDHEKVLDMIQSGSMNLNKVYKHKDFHLTPLSLVIKYLCKTDLVNAIIKAGADVNATGWYTTYSRDRQTPISQQYVIPLYQAVVDKQDKDLVLQLIQAGANINSTDKLLNLKGNKSVLTPLIHRVIEMSSVNTELLQLLVTRGNDLDLNVVNADGLDILQFAITRGKFECARLLISHGFPWRYNCVQSRCPLTLLCRFLQSTDYYQSMARRQEGWKLAYTMLHMGYNVHRDTCYNDMAKTHSHTTNNQLLMLIFDTVRTWMCTFHGLQYWCRLSIKNSAQRPLKDGELDSLNLPAVLQKYLLFLDVQPGILPVIPRADVNKLTGMSRFKEEEGGSMEFCVHSTCLHHCITKIKDAKIRSEILIVLLEHSADYDLPNDHGFNALQLSLMEQQANCVMLLVRYGCTGSNLVSSIYSPLAIHFEAAHSTGVSILRVLLSGGYKFRNDEECSDIMKSTSDSSILLSEWRDSYEELRKWLYQPLSLKVICRLCIRQYLKKRCKPRTLFSLPLPKSLQHYLNLDDVIDI